ncbi:protein of unknown function [Lentzea xinjiangensis]|uniref:Protein-glutamine gamma-glutamyltransferase-like C-terminal domain-containing protein n=1 Tax=Lentzea xinjiangensis TaxID=402600 RepID=A0A1H9SJF9_9PSEU|nr:DUF4129 domain-containing protein [Lentzea xinjiangensis]SER85102.1 protein of unknown function [Lentzea xinjiangensis]
MVAADVPVDPGRDEAREAAARELSDPAYVSDDPNPLQRAVDWVLDRLGELFAGAGGVSGITAVTVLVVVAVVVAIVIRLRTGRTGRALRSSGEVFGTAVLTAAEHRAAADRAAAAGDLAEAVRERFRAVVRELEQRGVLDARAGRTVDEAASEAGRALPALAGDLRGAAVQFDDVFYGGRPATEEGYRRLVSVDDGVRG